MFRSIVMEKERRAQDIEPFSPAPPAVLRRHNSDVMVNFVGRLNRDMSHEGERTTADER